MNNYRRAPLPHSPSLADIAEEFSSPFSPQLSSIESIQQMCLLVYNACHEENALGVVAAVVTFVEFSGKLLTVAQKCYRDSRNPIDTKDDIANLQRMSENLLPTLKNIQGAYGYPLRPNDSTAADQSNNADLNNPATKLYVQSRKIHNDINILSSRIIDSERSHLSKFFHAGLRKLGHLPSPEHLDDFGPARPGSPKPSEKEVTKIRDALDDLRNDTMVYTQQVLWAKSDTMIQELRTISSGQANIATASANMQRRFEVIEKVWLSSREENPRGNNDDSRSGSTGQFGQFGQRKCSSPQEMVLDTLPFTEMEYRERGIVDAHAKTCKWLFAGPDPDCTVEGDENRGRRAETWKEFPAWLRQDSSNIYWIAGKLGSGKSTLMKYLLGPGREKLKSNLGVWAGERPLAIASYYAWSGGKNEHQKSLGGLLKSLISQILEALPDLIPRVCPRHWAIFKLFGNQKTANSCGWTIGQLREAFTTILALSQQEGHCLAIFIDGLDEFIAKDQPSVLEFMEETCKTSPVHVKICAASRPWVEFQEPFKSKPSLHMERLTKEDIDAYVSEKFRVNLGLEELKERYGAEQMNALVREVVEKAEGVFLWVSVATKTLSGAMIGGAAMPELRDLLLNLPQSLNDLYQQVWEGLDDTNKWETFMYIQIVDAHEGPLDVATMFAAEQPEPYEAATVSPQLQRKQLYRRVLSKARGLLELSGDGIISYHHRSLHDWISVNRVKMKDIEKRIPDSQSFDPNLRLAIANVAILLAYPDRPQLEGTRMCLLYASRVMDIHDRVANLTASLDKLDRPYKSLLPSEVCGSAQPTQTILGLAAQLAVSSYVKTKVLQDKSILKPNVPRQGASILENALCIPGRRLDDFAADDMESCSETSLKDRVELISFLLKNGADPNEVSVLLDHIIPLSFSSKRRHRLLKTRGPTPTLSDKIQQLSVKATSFPRYNPWFVTEVGRLFEEHPPKKAGLNKLLDRIHL